MHIQALPKTSFFITFWLPNWSWSLSGRGFKKNFPNDATFMSKLSEKGPRKDPDGPQDGPKSTFFRSGASELRLLVPRVPGWGVPDPNRPQNPLKIDPKIMKKMSNQIIKISYTIYKKHWIP